MQAKRGFTLVEILIVVVILGILAAIVIPQFTEASTEAKLSSLCSDLQTVRSQIELYKVQHNDTMPGTVAGVSFSKAMTGGTTLAGAIDATAPYDYGPYLQAIPKNPFTDTNTVEVGTGAPGAGNNAWYFNTDTGDFRADDDAHKTY
jgi:general secretion pathway protein G